MRYTDIWADRAELKDVVYEAWQACIMKGYLCVYVNVVVAAAVVVVVFVVVVFVM